MVHLNDTVSAWRLSKMCSRHRKHNAKVFRVILTEDVKMATGSFGETKMRICNSVCKLTMFAKLSHILRALPAMREALKTLTPYEALDYMLKKEGEKWDPSMGYT
ncbi:hypothetical protein ACFX2F_043455 [Malus domestica]